MYRWECNLQNQPIKKSAAIKSANPSFDMLHISQSECLKRSTTDGHTHGHYSRVSPVVPTDISAKSTLIVYWPYTLYLTSVYSVDYNKVMSMTVNVYPSFRRTWFAKSTQIVYWPSYPWFYLKIFGWLRDPSFRRVMCPVVPTDMVREIYADSILTFILKFLPQYIRLTNVKWWVWRPMCTHGQRVKEHDVWTDQI